MPLQSFAFWEFSLTIYAQSGVKQACLTLQDNYGLNVNMLLFCCWVAHAGYGYLSHQELHQAITLIDEWHQKVTLPLRQRRKKVSKLHKGVPAKTYKRLLKQELHAEYQEQRQLATIMHNIPKANVSTKQRYQHVLANLNLYLEIAEIDFVQVRTLLSHTLLAALFP